MLALHVSPADEQDRAHAARPAVDVQEATGSDVEVAFVDQGDTSADAAADADVHGIELLVRQFGNCQAPRS